MKIVFFALLLVSQNVFAVSYTNFSGDWSGFCLFNGEKIEKKKIIKQLEDQTIIINGMKFNVGKTTSYERVDQYNGNKYQEVSVYDFSWNESKSEIKTKASWLGWNLNKNGSWSGKGLGVVKIENEVLIMNRSYKSEHGTFVENCEFRK